MSIIKNIIGMTIFLFGALTFFSWYLPMLNPKVQVYIDAGYLGMGGVLAWITGIIGLFITMGGYENDDKTLNKGE